MIRCSHLDTLHRSDLKSLSNQIQNRAVKRMDRSGWTENDITDDLLDYALQTKQKLVRHAIGIPSRVHIHLQV